MANALRVFRGLEPLVFTPPPDGAHASDVIGNNAYFNTLDVAVSTIGDFTLGGDLYLNGGRIFTGTNNPIVIAPTPSAIGVGQTYFSFNPATGITSLAGITSLGGTHLVFGNNGSIAIAWTGVCLNVSQPLQIDPPSTGIGITFANDNQYDIGASGSNRPRNIYAGGEIFSSGVNSTFLQIASACVLWSGSGVPSAATGQNGDFFFREDAPGTANQRIYVKSAGAWIGIV